MLASGLLDKSVDLSYWAQKTENFTGAELVEKLVKNLNLSVSTIFTDYIK